MTVPTSPAFSRTPVLAYYAATFVLYAGAQLLSMQSAEWFRDNTGLWPAAAIGLVMILGAPEGTRTQVALLTALANAVAHAVVDTRPYLFQFVAVATRLVADWGGALLTLRVLGDRPSFERTGWLARFALLVALVITPLASILGASLYVGEIRAELAGRVVMWYIPEVIMVLTVGPAIWILRDVNERWSRTSTLQRLHGFAMLLLLASATLTIMRYPVVAGITVPLSLAIVPILIYIAYWFGTGVTAWAGVLVMAILVTATAVAVGPFANPAATGMARFVPVELYAAALILPAIVLATVFGELRDSSERLQRFLDTSTNAIVAVDRMRRVVGFSPAADAMYRIGSGTSLALGMDPLERVQGTTDFMRLRARGWQRALSGEVEVAVVQPDGDRRIELRYEPMRNSQGLVVGAVSTATDLVQRERDAEESARVNRHEAIGRVAGGIVHDVNNLMTVILGQVYTLRKQVPTSEGTAALDEIELTVERTKRLSAQLLAFSRSRPIEPVITELHQEVFRTLDMLRRVLEENAVLETHFADHNWHIAVDRSQLEQLLLNLVTNARDAMPHGGRVRLSTTSVTLDDAEADRLGLSTGDYVQLDVADSGAGIPSDAISRIFDPFYSSKGARGHGLGLATVRAIMLKAGGTVTVESVVGQGTVFHLYFPRTLAPVTTSTSDEHPAPLSTARLTGRVVVCEDEPAIRRVVARTLTSAGCTVHECATPLDVLELLAHNATPMDLLITDVVMPEMSGIELMQRVRSTSPDLRVLLMTGYSEELVDHLQAHERPDVVLAKPFRGEDLISAVRGLLT